MIILFEILLIAVLLMITITVIIDESNHRKRAKHLVRLKAYWDGSNRRRVLRHNAVLDVNYSCNKQVKPSRSKDISSHGIGLLLAEKLNRRTVMMLEIKIDEVSPPIRAKAKVMWSKEASAEDCDSGKRLFHTGIKFVKFADSRQEKTLFDYIRSTEKDFSEGYESL